MPVCCYTIAPGGNDSNASVACRAMSAREDMRSTHAVKSLANVLKVSSWPPPCCCCCCCCCGKGDCGGGCGLRGVQSRTFLGGPACGAHTCIGDALMQGEHVRMSNMNACAMRPHWILSRAAEGAGPGAQASPGMQPWCGAPHHVQEEVIEHLLLCPDRPGIKCYQ